MYHMETRRHHTPVVYNNSSPFPSPLHCFQNQTPSPSSLLPWGVLLISLLGAVMFPTTPYKPVDFIKYQEIEAPTTSP